MHDCKLVKVYRLTVSGQWSSPRPSESVALLLLLVENCIDVLAGVDEVSLSGKLNPTILEAWRVLAFFGFLL